jgi:hypothetical protein
MLWRLLPRHQPPQDSRNQKQHQHIAVEMSDILMVCNRLHDHNAPMDYARPDREPDQAAMLKRVSGCDEQEDSKRGVDADDHRQVVGLSHVPDLA